MADPVAARPRIILIVDDDPDVADSLAMMLRMLGHEVGVAYDGRRAIDVARTLRPEVVLMDLGLPQMSGFALAQQLRQELAGAKLSVVAVTGFVDDDSRQRAREAGFDAFLAKPASIDDLERVLAPS
jgi:CheY-like chemotaxis protein